MTGYNSSVITDPDGNNVYGYSYCLDYKLVTPGGNTYTRIPLSSMDKYSTLEKTRLAKLVVYRSDIINYCFNTYGLENVFAYERDNYFIPSLNSLNVPSGINDVASFNSKTDVFTDRRTLIQHILWAVVHSDFDQYVHDDGTTVQDGLNHEDHYYFSESNYYYVSADPINDPHSLWNILYQPLIDYIDSLEDPMTNGIDIWVYDSVDTTHQNVLGSVIDFADVDISKVDAEGNMLSGATLQVLDWNGNVVSEWTSDGTVHNVSRIYPGMTYTLHEVSAPDGYDISSDITFSVSEDGTTDISGTDTLTMVDNETVIETTATTVSESTTVTSTDATAVATLAITSSETSVTENTTASETMMNTSETASSSDTVTSASESAQVQGAVRQNVTEEAQTNQSAATTSAAVASTGEQTNLHIVIIAVAFILCGSFCLMLRRVSGDY